MIHGGLHSLSKEDEVEEGGEDLEEGEGPVLMVHSLLDRW